MRYRLFFFLLLVSPWILTGGAASAQAQDVESVLEALRQRAERRTVSVNGEGRVQVEPDQATVRFSVVTRADSPEEARRQNAEAAKNAMNAVRELDVPERKIQMETLRLQPIYEYDDKRNRRELVGYEATRTVVVELNELETLPVLVARVVEQGANQLEGVEYGLQDRTQARNEALREAVNDARGKAELMAEELGEELGLVMQINEQDFHMPRPERDFRAMAESAAKADAVPEPEAYAAGELEVHTNVRVTFGLQ